MMSLAQLDRLRSISESIRRSKYHPNQKIVEAMKPYGPDDINKATDYIQKLIDENNGWEAHQIIGAYKSGWEVGAIKKIIELDI